jgi:hypothetical protein
MIAVRDVYTTLEQRELTYTWPILSLNRGGGKDKIGDEHGRRSAKLHYACDVLE